MIAGPCSVERGGDRGEHRERGEAHHVIGDLEHDLHQPLDPAHQRLGGVADGGDRDPEEHREDDDRQDVVLGHRIGDRRGHDVRDEILEAEGRLVDPAGGSGRRQRQVETDAGLEEIDQQQAERQRHDGRADEPAEAAHADPAERGGVAHVRDPDHQGGKDQRRDDHLDQAQEQRGDDAQIVGDRFQLGGAFGRAIVERRVRRPAGNDAQHEREQDEFGQFVAHVRKCLSPVARETSR